MTDATTGPAVEGDAADDRTNRTTITPTPQEVTEEAGPATGPATGRLLPHEESDKLELRLRQAVAGFVDGPRDSVAEADHVVEEIAGRFTEAVTRRRRTLRMSWQEGDRKETAPDTEQLRLALRDYRELAELLLRS